MCQEEGGARRKKKKNERRRDNGMGGWMMLNKKLHVRRTSAKHIAYGLAIASLEHFLKDGAIPL